MRASFIVSALGAVLIGLCFFEFPDVPDDLKLDIDHYSPEIQAWFKRGSFASVFGLSIFYVSIPFRGTPTSSTPTFVLVHGFPTSSFDFSRLVDRLSETGHVLVHDHPGFGFSDKPRKNFTYSIFEYADVALGLYLQLRPTNVHLVAHDMGDSITAEIITRRFRGLLPDSIASEIRSVVFTNGGMQIRLSNFRLSQILLKSPAGAFFNWLVGFDTGHVFHRRQLNSIWSPTYPNPAQRDIDITHILELLGRNGGTEITYRTIRYLQDRKEFEYRWEQGLESIDIPCLLLWGDADAVAPVTIPHALRRIAPNCSIKVLNNVGHFLMLEDGEGWLDGVTSSIDTSIRSS